MGDDFTEIKIIRSKRKTLSLSLDLDGTLVVKAPLRYPQSKIDKFISDHQAWISKASARAENSRNTAKNLGFLTDADVAALKKQAAEYFPQRLEYFAGKFGTSYNKLTVRCQRTRWGSCNAKKNISLNCLLMLVPEDVRDSVIAHEVCHIKHMDHSRKFYDELISVFPEYRRCEKWLKENGTAVLMRAGAKNE